MNTRLNLRIGIWIWFLVWSLVGVFLVSANVQTPGGGWADFVFIALAATLVTYAWSDTFGRRFVWKPFAWVVLVSGLVESIGHWTGFPFGNYAYTDAFGPRIGPLPLAIPLAWWIIIAGLFLIFREIVRTLPYSPTVVRYVLISAVATGAVVIDLVIEPVAFLVRGYWLWEGGGIYYQVPIQNFVAWFALSFVLTQGLYWWVDDNRKTSAGAQRAVAIVLIAMLALFAAACVVRSWWSPTLFALSLAGILGYLSWFRKQD